MIIMSEDLEEITIENDQIADQETVLKVDNLTKKFDEIVAVNRVSFEVTRGEILGIIGANGSGKTTLFNLISGVHDPTNGRIYGIRKKKSILQVLIDIISFRKKHVIDFDGNVAENIERRTPNDLVNNFGIVRTFQIVRPFKFLTTQENVTVPHVPRKPFASPSGLKTASIRSLLDVDLGEKKNYPAFILPHGDLKRLDIARALACDPIIILLDEPYSGLGAEDSFRLTQLIKRANQEFGVTIMIVEHKLKFLANLVTRIIVLDQGSVLAIGTPKEISENKTVISAYLGKEASHIA